MPHLLLSQRCLGSTALSSDGRHGKGDVKGVFGFLRSKSHAAAASALFGSPGTHSNPFCHRTTTFSSHSDAPPASADAFSLSATTADAASSPTVDSDADWEAVRLMTAAKILASSSSTDDVTSDDITLSHDDDSSVLSVASSAQHDSSADLGPDLLGPLALLDDIQTLDADSLALAVGILRQRQPEDASEDGVQLSERLRDFLMVLRRRPGAATAGLSAAHASDASTPAAAGAGSTAVDADDGFWSGKDEWADVRSALMGIGINASLDEEEDEDVWALEAGRVKTRRTRLLRSLPKLDSSTAQQLTAFLAEVQQHTPAGPQHSSDGTVATAAAPAAAGTGDGTAGTISEEEEQWWQQATLAYSLLRQQAGKVQQEQEQEQEEVVVKRQ